MRCGVRLYIECRHRNRRLHGSSTKMTTTDVAGKFAEYFLVLQLERQYKSKTTSNATQAGNVWLFYSHIEAGVWHGAVGRNFVADNSVESFLLVAELVCRDLFGVGEVERQTVLAGSAS